MFGRLATSFALSIVVLATGLAPVAAQTVRKPPCLRPQAKRYAPAFAAPSEAPDLLGCPITTEFEIAFTSQRSEVTDFSIAALEFSTYPLPGDSEFDLHTAPVGAEIPEATLSIAATLSQGLGSVGNGRPMDSSLPDFQQDGSVQVWGDDPGQMAGGPATAWARASDGPPRVAVQRSSQFSVELNVDGSVWTSGANNLGQLDDGATADQPTPVQVQGLHDIMAIASGEAHTLALDRGGYSLALVPNPPN